MVSLPLMVLSRPDCLMHQRLLLGVERMWRRAFVTSGFDPIWTSVRRSPRLTICFGHGEIRNDPVCVHARRGGSSDMARQTDGSVPCCILRSQAFGS